MTFHDFNAKLDGRKFLRRKLYNGAGTGARWNTWNDPTNIIAEQVDPRYWERGGIDYPAQAVPMGGSVKAGVAEHIRLLDTKDPNQEWAGVYYSQMGIVAYKVYQAIRNTRHAETLKAMVILGPPCRALNTHRGNDYGHLPLPKDGTRGIADERFSGTEPEIYDFVNPGDIYGEVADNDVGEDMTMIFRIVQNPKAILLGKDSGLEQVTEIMKSPLLEGISAVRAVWNGLTFVTTQPWATYPHTSYHLNGSTDAAVRLLNEIGSKWPVKM